MLVKILILTLVFNLPSFGIHKIQSKWVVSKNSSLNVKGSTNINRFSCSITDYSKGDTVTINRETGNQVALTGRVSIAIKHFDCNNSLMTKQLLKTLKGDQFPFLYITFISLKGIPLTARGDNEIKGLVDIELAGVRKRFSIIYQLTNRNGSMALSGSQEIKFSDFRLQPPHKIGKLIKAKDQLNVSFELQLWPLQLKN